MYLWQGETILVKFHCIPNFEFGTFGVRHYLNIIFLGLWSKEHSKANTPYHMTKQECTLWYNKGLHPMIRSLLGKEVASKWPASYRTEEIWAQRVRGGYSWETKVIPQHAIGDLMECIQLLVSQDVSFDWQDIAWKVFLPPSFFHLPHS